MVLRFFLLGITTLLVGCASFALESVGTLAAPAINESSGLVASSVHEGVYWTHNDSGDSARIFPVYIDGRSVEGFEEGIIVEGARNRDWEDIASDGKGNLIIGACGNNGNQRRDLSLLIVPEPDVTTGSQTVTLEKKIPFAYPDQKAFPPEKRNFDCEAVFYADGHLYLLTKHRSDRDTKLYRIDESAEGNLVYLETYPIGGMVTAADAQDDKLAVLTYDDLFIFTRKEEGSAWLRGNVVKTPIAARQSEAVCFTPEGAILITNEQRDIFTLPAL